MEEIAPLEKFDVCVGVFYGSRLVEAVTAQNLTASVRGNRAESEFFTFKIKQHSNETNNTANITRKRA